MTGSQESRPPPRIPRAIKGPVEYVVWLAMALALVFLTPFLYLPKFIAVVLLSVVTNRDSDYWDRRLDMWWLVPWAVIGAVFWVTLGVLLALG